jgi:hypothetical protein
MGDYLKLFETTSDYEAYIEGQDVLLPNVSYCEDNNGVYYTPLEIVNIITIEMTGGDSLIFDAGTKSDGTSLAGVILRTGETIEIIQAPITVHLQNADTTSGLWSLDKNVEYTTVSGDTYFSDERPPRCNETITLTPLEDITFYADID